MTHNEMDDHSGYYQGPLGIETDQPQKWTKPITPIFVTAGALMVWAAIWFAAVAVIRLI